MFICNENIWIKISEIKIITKKTVELKSQDDNSTWMNSIWPFMYKEDTCNKLV